MTELTKMTEWSGATASRWLPPPLDLCDTGREHAAAPAIDHVAEHARASRELDDDLGRYPGSNRRRRPAPDTRYQHLLGAAQWASLPLPIRRRFSKPRRTGEVTVYRGHIVACEMSRAGWLVATLARLIGAPLPLDAWPATEAAHDRPQPPATVIVEEMPHTHGTPSRGQVWTRIYGRCGRFPQVITSAKVFTDPAPSERSVDPLADKYTVAPHSCGLEEHLGAGLIMRLAVTAEDGALVFRSTGYHWHWGPLQIAVPALLSPGQTEIVHRAEADATGAASLHDFTFTLTLTHPLLGRLVHQAARFSDGDTPPAAREG